MVKEEIKKNEDQLKEDIEQETSRVRKEAENKWHTVIGQYKQEIRELKLVIERKDNIIATQEEEIIDYQKKNHRLEERLKQSEADFVYLSKQKRDDGVRADRSERPNFLESYLAKKGYKV